MMGYEHFNEAQLKSMAALALRDLLKAAKALTELEKCLQVFKELKESKNGT